MNGISSLKHNDNSGAVNTYGALGISSGLWGCIPLPGHPVSHPPLPHGCSRCLGSSKIVLMLKQAGLLQEGCSTHLGLGLHSLVTCKPDHVTRHSAHAGVPTWPALLELNRNSEKCWERKHVAKANPLVCYYLKETSQLLLHA